MQGKVKYLIWSTVGFLILIYYFIHPSIHPPGYTLNRLQPYCRANTYRETTTYNHSHSYGHFFCHDTLMITLLSLLFTCNSKIYTLALYLADSLPVNSNSIICSNYYTATCTGTPVVPTHSTVYPIEHAHTPQQPPSCPNLLESLCMALSLFPQPIEVKITVGCESAE